MKYGFRLLLKIMNTIFRFLCVACICTLGFAKSYAASTNGFRVTVELQDGSRVVGKSGDEKFEFRSEILGGLKLPLEQIASIECQPKTNAVKLTAVNGDKLALAFLTTEIHIETSFGKVKVPADSIRRMQISASNASGRTKSGLVALWSAEVNANDSVGNCNGQLMNGVGFMPGKVGQAFDLNENVNGSFGGGGGYGVGIQAGRIYRGNGGFVLIPASPDLDVGKGDGFTMECWIKPASVSRVMVIFENERELGTGNGADVGLGFAIHNTLPNGMSGPCLYANILDDGSNAHEIVTPAGVLTAGNWQHIALTYDKVSGIAAFYVNGTEVSQSNLGSFTPQTSFGSILLGARTTFNSVSNPGDTFSGGMDEFGIYNRALSAAEIQAICTEQNNGQPLPPPAVAHGLAAGPDSMSE
jgi:hypothetical protein